MTFRQNYQVKCHKLVPGYQYSCHEYEYQFSKLYLFSKHKRLPCVHFVVYVTSVRLDVLYTLGGDFIARAPSLARATVIQDA